ncbi:MAG: single-stranded DNA-binding protein [Clostridium sp.]|nr:single-stranded DNA-binding protein [Clostridium sp.]
MSLNKVMLIGNVGKDPEVRYLDTGVAVATFPLATTERGYTLQNGTTVPERAEWHNIVLWRGLAETAEKYVHKGDKLYIEGKIRSRTYDDKNGMKRYVYEIMADSMELLTSRPQTPAVAGGQPSVQSAPAPSAIGTARSATSLAGSSDDLPF